MAEESELFPNLPHSQGVQKDLLGNPIDNEPPDKPARKGRRKLSGSSADKDKSPESRRGHPYWVPRGTAIWSGPYGKDETQRLADLAEQVLVRPVYEDNSGGFPSFMVEVESPPERKGERFIIARNPKRKGWIR